MIIIIEMVEMSDINYALLKGFSVNKNKKITKSTEERIQ